MTDKPPTRRGQWVMPNTPLPRAVPIDPGPQTPGCPCDRCRSTPPRMDCDCACHRLGSEMIAADCPCRRHHTAGAVITGRPDRSGRASGSGGDESPDSDEPVTAPVGCEWCDNGWIGSAECSNCDGPTSYPSVTDEP